MDLEFQYATPFFMHHATVFFYSSYQIQDQKLMFINHTKCSVQGVVALGDHFATLCWELDFYEAIFFTLLIFKTKRQRLLHF
jgi:hypothetical protein